SSPSPRHAMYMPASAGETWLVSSMVTFGRKLAPRSWVEMRLRRSVPEAFQPRVRKPGGAAPSPTNFGASLLVPSSTRLVETQSIPNPPAVSAKKLTSARLSCSLSTPRQAMKRRSPSDASAGDESLVSEGMYFPLKVQPPSSENMMFKD